MNQIFFLILIGFYILSILWMLRIYLAYLWLKKNRSIKLGKKNTDQPVYIIIPLLKEVGRIEQTVQYFLNNFLNKHIKLVLVTTEKENKSSKNKISTIEVAKNLAEKYPNIQHYHYPYKNGVMAHQLNFAIKNIINKNCKKDILFAIYNADSNPELETFDWILQKIEKNPKIKVLQQYGNYTKNLNNFRYNISGNTLSSAALWQTRWSIGFEIFNALKQFKLNSKIKKLFFYPLNYCIGHGLFMKREIFEKVGGFNEKMHNEDAILGLELSYLGEKIYPIPYFDLSDTPNKINYLFKQKTNWFYGPFQAFKYYKFLGNKKNIQNFLQKIKLFVLTAKLFLHSIYWFMGPTLFFASFIIMIFNLNVFMALLFLTEAILFIIIPSYLAILLLSKVQQKNLSKGLIIRISSGSILAFFLHGLSAYTAIFQILANKLFGIKIIKEKTPMDSEIKKIKS